MRLILRVAGQLAQAFWEIYAIHLRLNNVFNKGLLADFNCLPLAVEQGDQRSRQHDHEGQQKDDSDKKPDGDYDLSSRVLLGVDWDFFKALEKDRL